MSAPFGGRRRQKLRLKSKQHRIVSSSEGGMDIGPWLYPVLATSVFRSSGMFLDRRPGTEYTMVDMLGREHCFICETTMVDELLFLVRIINPRLRWYGPLVLLIIPIHCSFSSIPSSTLRPFSLNSSP